VRRARKRCGGHAIATPAVRDRRRGRAPIAIPVHRPGGGFVGNSAVTEIVPTGYTVLGGAGPRAVAVTTAGATCPNGDAVAFHNLPLTTITVTVDSLVVGGTSSVITCTGFTPVTTPTSGDGSLVMPSLGAGTYTCTVVVQ